MAAGEVREELRALVARIDAALVRGGNYPQLLRELRREMHRCAESLEAAQPAGGGVAPPAAGSCATQGLYGTGGEPGWGRYRPLFRTRQAGSLSVWGASAVEV